MRLSFSFKAKDWIQLSLHDFENCFLSYAKLVLVRRRAARLFPEVDVTEELVRTVETVLAKKATDRSVAERKAETACRTAISRLFTRFDISNLEPRGGSNKITSAEKTAKQAAEAIPGSEPIRVTATEFGREVAWYQNLAIGKPIIVTRSGHDRTVLISAAEYGRLKRRVR